ncbi:uncharacterized protein BX663DRAFT_72604 [Cokeromyces recurvatus]|uniref:uncharacterized protein n=1 Tax=Cokeromyces recurvatus TaxID=90255 RepID=UPI00221EECFC|nr:uncharacterized protein BX663DRAFT_72604 [Cokeromyces recurvatus]KAI7902334.1 hypothetical protein BX663DRAFT_72604 [Cokeromyces recurvatus]
MNAEREPLLGEESNTNPERNQDNEDYSDTNRRFQNGKFSLLEKVLFILAVVFFIALCIVTGLYTRRVSDENPKQPPNVPRHDNSSPICTEPECVLTAAQILKDIDLTVDPCEDFYQFTCKLITIVYMSKKNTK